MDAVNWALPLNRMGRASLYALIALMIAGWTGNYIAGKIALQTFPPVLLFGLRISMAGVLILPAYGWERRQRTACSAWPSTSFCSCSA